MSERDVAHHPVVHLQSLEHRPQPSDSISVLTWLTMIAPSRKATIDIMPSLNEGNATIVP